MKNKHFLFPVISLLLFIIQQHGLSQATDSLLIEEKIVSFTDRKLYLSGEKIYLSFWTFVSKPFTEDLLSRVAYAELITPQGNRITGGKFELTSNYGSGCLYIPDDTESGVYYLKTYTRLMRNNGPEQYHYEMIKIVHPLKPSVLAGYDSVSYSNDSLEDEFFSSLQIVSNKGFFSPGSLIQLTLSREIDAKSQLIASLSVVPEASLPLTDWKNEPKIMDHGSTKRSYFQENRGVSLSGKLVVEATNETAIGTKVNLSVFGIKDLFVTQTDAFGRFFFALPYQRGSHDLFLSTEEVSRQSTKLLIDNDYCNRQVELPAPAFYLSENEEKTVMGFLLNQAVSQWFQKQELQAIKSIKNDTLPFYGLPSEVLVLDNFVELPSLEEYFNELPMMVKVRKSKEEKHFRFYSTQAEMAIYPPLVLVDWVPIEQVEKVLAMSPRSIERIELVNAPYFKGDILYGGIISFVSKNGDFAGIDLPSTGTFLPYDFFNDCKCDSFVPSATKHHPDTRNTAIWKTDIVLKNDSNQIIEFVAPQTPGVYRAMLQSMNQNGEMESASTTFEIVAID